MRVGSLFTGIGGLDLGLERAGFEIIWQVEIDPWCRALLGQHWPEVKKFGDIKLCGAHNLESVDLIFGGFPCQDISSAGKQAGIEGERSGLWREQARIIGELKPRYVLVENVAALLYATKQRDGTRRPAAIQRVLRDLAALGYDAVWRVCSAAEFGAPHLRKRVFIVAYLPYERGGTRRAEPAGQWGQANAHSSGAADVEHAAGAGQQKRTRTTRLHTKSDSSGPQMADAESTKRDGRGPAWDGRARSANSGATMADADSNRCGRRKDQPEPGSRSQGAANARQDGERGNVADTESREGRWAEQRGVSTDAGPGGAPLAHPANARLQERNEHAGAQPDQWRGSDDGGKGDAQSCLGRVFDGFPPRLDGIEHQWPAGPGQEQYTWEPPRVIQSKLKNRVARLKGLGNAALPQIAEAMGYGIRRHAERQGLEAGRC